MTKLSTLVVAFFALSIFMNSTPVSAAELVKYKVVGNAIPKSLTGKAGDAKRGRKLAINRKKGNCLACHTMPAPKQADHGTIGVTLYAIGKRYNIGQLRLRLVDSKRINPATIMPAFYRNTGLHRVQKKWKGKTVLKAQEVEDILAYLMTLKKF
jgi:L-cysteine S-thiosulfotransferase